MTCCTPGRSECAAPLAVAANESLSDALAYADASAPPRISFKGGRSHTGTRAPLIPEDGEGIVTRHRLKSFDVETVPVTNARFAAFVAATGYRTTSEVLGHGIVFRYLSDDPSALPKGNAQTPWWAPVNGACWHAPEGPGSGIGARMQHPVVHISFDDAKAFCDWVGGRLPSEAEWEHCARGGLEDPRFPWGEREPDETDFLPANIWQGRFPDGNTAADGWKGTSPVDAFPANGAGLHDLVGNVWEWTADPFRIRSAARYAQQRNKSAGQTRQKVMKGGSFLCHISYCYRYRIAARSATEPDSGSANCGFRVFY